MTDFLTVVIWMVALLAIAAPIMLVVIVDRQVSGFQRESFGRYQDAAKWFRIVGWTFFVSQYAAIMIYGSFDGAIQGMFRYPLSLVSIGLYVQMASVVLVFGLALGVSRALSGIVKG